MAFIEKTDPIVLNIKLTSKGRELLARGELDFKYFTIGDSEIDYKFNNDVNIIDENYTSFNSSILKPVDINPEIISFIPKNLNGDQYNETPIDVPAYVVENQVDSIGFFKGSENNMEFITDSNHMRQPDVMVDLGTVDGGLSLTLLKAPTYGSSGEEPQVGDLLFIRWTRNVSTTGYTVNKSYPTPNLIYRIESIVSGSIASGSMVVNIDRQLPKLSAFNGIYAGVFVYYNNINYSGGTVSNMTPTQYLNESVISFLENSQCPTIVFPFWNMSIIFTEEIAGVQAGNLKYTEFTNRSLGGFVSYIQNQSPKYKKLGIIHYTNSSSANIYAEGFLRDTAVLEIPTIMWHKSNTPTLGATFVPSGNSKQLIGETKSLNIKYYDLVDFYNPSIIVGKVFNDLKIFVIEDQELLFAMSYKSNRNWTLPDFNVKELTTLSIQPRLNTISAVEEQTYINGVYRSKIKTGGINIVRYMDVIAYGVQFKVNSPSITTWSLYPSPPTYGHPTTNQYIKTINSLLPSTKYDYRAFVVIYGVQYFGEIKTITTLSIP